MVEEGARLIRNGIVPFLQLTDLLGGAEGFLRSPMSILFSDIGIPTSQLIRLLLTAAHLQARHVAANRGEVMTILVALPSETVGSTIKCGVPDQEAGDVRSSTRKDLEVDVASRVSLVPLLLTDLNELDAEHDSVADQHSLAFNALYRGAIVVLLDAPYWKEGMVESHTAVPESLLRMSENEDRQLLGHGATSGTGIQHSRHSLFSHVEDGRRGIPRWLCIFSSSELLLGKLAEGIDNEGAAGLLAGGEYLAQGMVRSVLFPILFLSRAGRPADNVLISDLILFLQGRMELIGEAEEFVLLPQDESNLVTFLRRAKPLTLALLGIRGRLLGHVSRISSRDPAIASIWMRSGILSGFVALATFVFYLAEDTTLMLHLSPPAYPTRVTIWLTCTLALGVLARSLRGTAFRPFIVALLTVAVLVLKTIRRLMTQFTASVARDSRVAAATLATV